MSSETIHPLNWEEDPSKRIESVPFPDFNIHHEELAEQLVKENEFLKSVIRSQRRKNIQLRKDKASEARSLNKAIKRLKEQLENQI